MTRLDLHNIRHQDVATTLEHTLNSLWGEKEELKIITGHSEKMRKIVIDILDDYGLEYQIGDWSGQNMGFIKTYLD